jgi:hypothetical protein
MLVAEGTGEILVDGKVNQVGPVYFYKWQS